MGWIGNVVLNEKWMMAGGIYVLSEMNGFDSSVPAAAAASFRSWTSDAWALNDMLS